MVLGQEKGKIFAVTSPKCLESEQKRKLDLFIKVHRYHELNLHKSSSWKAVSIIETLLI